LHNFIFTCFSPTAYIVCHLNIFFIVSMTLRNAKEKKLMTVYLEMLVQDNRIVNSGSLQQNIFQLLNKKLWLFY